MPDDAFSNAQPKSAGNAFVIYVSLCSLLNCLMILILRVLAKHMICVWFYSHWDLCVIFCQQSVCKYSQNSGLAVSQFSWYIFSTYTWGFMEF